MIFFLISSNSYQSSISEKKMELKKLEPDLKELAISNRPENVRVIVWLDKKISTNSFEQLGKVRYKYNIIPAIAMEIPIERLKDFEELSDVRKVVLDRKIQAFRSESMPLIKADVASVDFGVNGTGINVSVIDTGVYNHTEFQSPNRIVKQKCYCIGCCPPNDADESDNATDDEGHGTHVAGIAVGKGNGNGYGVATNASLFAVKVLDSAGYGQDSDVVAAIDWAVNNRANVISLSLGAKYYTFTDCYELAFSEAVDNATKQGAVVVVSAGNEGSYGSGTIGAPGCAKRAITVGATNDNDVIAAFSSKGPTNDNRTKPDLTAPGVNINSTYNTGPTDYASGEGTSQAAPHVTGVATLLLQKYNQNHGYLPDPDMVKAILLTAVNTTGMENAGYGQRNNAYGAGRIDAYEALRIINFTMNNTVSQGQEHHYKINVTNADLKVTLYWP
jgi:serine protease AprX